MHLALSTTELYTCNVMYFIAAVDSSQWYNGELRLAPNETRVECLNQNFTDIAPFSPVSVINNILAPIIMIKSCTF